MPLTNLKRRMSETDDVPRHLVRQDAVKKENRTFSERTLSNQFQNVKRKLSMDPPKQANTPNLTHTSNLTLCMPPQNTPSQLVKNEIKNPFSIMSPNMGSPNMVSVRRGYNKIIMEENRVIWVTKWVDYSNK